MSKPRLMLYPKNSAMDALDAWKNGHGDPPDSLRRYSHITLPLHDAVDDPTYLARLHEFYPDQEFVLYWQPLNIERPEQRVYPIGSLRDRQQKIAVKTKAFVADPRTWGYNNLDLRRCKQQLADLTNEAMDPYRQNYLFLDTMSVGGSLGMAEQRDYEGLLLEFDDAVSAQWSNHGGQWGMGDTFRQNSSKKFFERVPVLFLDGTWAGGLNNRVNGLLSHWTMDSILFVCNFADDSAMPTDAQIGQALAVCLLTDSILVAGSANGANRPDLAPLPKECFEDYGDWWLNPVRVATNCWERVSEKAYVAVNFSGATQMFTTIQRQLVPGEVVIRKTS